MRFVKNGDQTCTYAITNLTWASLFIKMVTKLKQKKHPKVYVRNFRNFCATFRTYFKCYSSLLDHSTAPLDHPTTPLDHPTTPLDHPTTPLDHYILKYSGQITLLILYVLRIPKISHIMDLSFYKNGDQIETKKAP